MKKSLLIMSIFGISLFMCSMAIAGTPDGETPAVETICEGVGLTGGAAGLCNAYCEALDCDDPAVVNEDCEDLRANFAKKTGKSTFPCDTVLACAICADADPNSQQGTIGECVNIFNSETAVEDCEDLGGTLEWAFPGYECSEITMPIALDLDNTYGGIGCDNLPGFIPDCQNGLPDFICGSFFLPGSVDLPFPEMCPYLPSCFEE
jgi:hypothetical protein